MHSTANTLAMDSTAQHLVVQRPASNNEQNMDILTSSFSTFNGWWRINSQASQMDSCNAKMRKAVERTIGL